MSSSAGHNSGNLTKASMSVSESWKYEWTVEQFSRRKPSTMTDRFFFQHRDIEFEGTLNLDIDDHDTVLMVELSPSVAVNEEWRLHFSATGGDVLRFERSQCILMKHTDLLSRIAVDDTLVMMVEVSLSVECNMSPIEANLQMLNNAMLTDVVIKVGDQELKAHRAILAMRSPVLATMFGNPSTDEAKTGIWSITDFAYETVQAFLKFVYGGPCPIAYSYVDVVQLLAMAQKYDIADLKQCCEGVCIRKYLKVNVACHLLVVADTYSARLLRGRVIEFIVANAEKVIETDGWKEFQSDRGHHDLICELFVRLVKRQA